MKSGKGHQEEEEEEEEEFGAKKDATSSANNSKGEHNQFFQYILRILMTFFLIIRILRVGVDGGIGCWNGIPC